MRPEASETMNVKSISGMLIVLQPVRVPVA